MEISTNNTQTMSSLEMSALTEKRHDSVKRTIESLMKQGVIQLTQSVEVKNHLGQSVSVYHFNKRDSYVIVAQLSPEFTARLVDRWNELEQKQLVNLNDPSFLRNALLGYTEKVLELQNTITEQAPKVEFYDKVADYKGAQDMNTVAKSFGIGRNTLFKLLREKCVLMSDNMPYQKQINSGRFKVVETTKDSRVYSQTLVTGKGLVWLGEILKGAEQ